MSAEQIFKNTENKNSFDWAIYADATLAGLSVLIPVPFVDSITEDYFRNRMVRSIASQRRQTLHPQAVNTVNRGQSNIWSRMGGCLFWPFRFAFDLVLRLSRKILYFLTVKRAIDSLNRYWQRAYLLDYMIRQGYLSHAEQLQPAVGAMEKILKDHSDSPLTKLARELVRSPQRIVKSVQRARHGEQDGEIDEARQTMSSSWNRYDDYFERLQNHFEIALAEQRSNNTLV